MRSTIWFASTCAASGRKRNRGVWRRISRTSVALTGRHLPARRKTYCPRTRGGDYEIHLSQDLSIGYLSHDSEHVELYLEESLTLLAITAESSVALQASWPAFRRTDLDACGGP